MTDLPIVFLGVSERAQDQKADHFLTDSVSLIGLRRYVASTLFPLPLGEVGFVFAIEPTNFDQALIRFTAEKGEELATSQIHLAVQKSDGPVPKIGPFEQDEIPNWVVIVVKLTDVNVVVAEPCTVMVTVDEGSQRRPLGYFVIGHLKAAPLTTDRISALKAMPGAKKKVSIVVGCKKCDGKLVVYCGLEKGVAAAGETWYEDLPSEFRCTCGLSVLPLAYLKEGMHVMLEPDQGLGALQITRLYEEQAIRAVYRGLLDALKKPGVAEEVVQQFLAKNRLCFHFLSPSRIFDKPPLLTKFKADFAALTAERELVLIEIERPACKLLTKKGDISAELSHAIDQVQSWLQVVSDHRLAVLDMLGLRQQDVARISGLVIAGRDEGYDAEHLRRLKGRDWGTVRVLTYDDLARSLNNLDRDFSKA